MVSMNSRRSEMKQPLMGLFIVFVFLVQGSVFGQSNSEADMPLTSAKNLRLINVSATPVTSNGKSGIEVKAESPGFRGETLVLIPGVLFANGTIEVELSGDVIPGADPRMRGFVGVAFRVDPENTAYYDCFYIRPRNGRAGNQVQRNHATQYVAHPEFPWHRLRRESAGEYESYVDLVPGEWTKLKLEISGNKARFYVHDSAQPVLIVNDLKHPEKPGLIGLWLHPTTLARYRNLKVRPGEQGNP